MIRGKGKFREYIYRICDVNVGKEVLFPAFMYWGLIIFGKRMTKQDLAVLTCDIVGDLIDREILVEVDKKFDTGYGLYKVLPHKKLVKSKEFNENKLNERFKLDY